MDSNNPERPLPRRRGVLRLFVSLLVAAAIWLPCGHLLFRPAADDLPRAQGLSPMAQSLAATHLATWSRPDLREKELAKMRGVNPEWDFMSRTFFVLALANMAERDPARREQTCTIIDAIIDNTLAVERENGFEHFLMAYGRRGGWIVRPAGSVFVDGEIAIMLAARRMLAEKPEYKSLLAERLAKLHRQMAASPVLCGESYPDECWMFCNSIALAAMKMQDFLDGTDHSAFLAAWVTAVRSGLVDKTTGLLIASFGVDGTAAPSGAHPEGSSIWLVAHMLQVVDEDFARDQYTRARRHLGRSLLGFGYSREWPAGMNGGMDIDSGPVLPLLEASASASGLAILSAAAFDDEAYLRELLTSVNFAGLPSETDGKLRFCAGNQVGDSVLLYALTEGPLWARLKASKP